MKIIISLGFLLIYLVTTPLVLAQAISSSSTVNLSAQATSNLAQVSQASPSTSLNSQSANKILTSLMARLKVLVSRVDTISQKINTRISKLNSSARLSNGNNKMVKLVEQQKDLSTNLEQLKISLEELNVISQTLSSNPNSRKEYPVFKNKMVSLNKNLKEIYKQESDLVTEMKKVASASVTPSIKVTPTNE